MAVQRYETFLNN